MLPLGAPRADQAEAGWLEPAVEAGSHRVLPRPLRRPARMLLRWQARHDWHLPKRFGIKAGALFFVTTAFAGMLLGGHLGNALSVTTAFVGLGIDKVTITGQSETSEVDVLKALGINAGSSLLTLDAAAARRRVEELPWVASAEIRKFYPGALRVTVTERDAFALWQHDGLLSVIDEDGKVLSNVVGPRYRDLVVMVGAGAAERATEITDLIARFPELQRQVRAAALVAERRWNLVLKDNVEVLLPEHDVETALKKLMAADVETGLLSGDIVSVDLRFADRFIVGLAKDAAAGRLKALEKMRKEAAKNGVRI